MKKTRVCDLLGIDYPILQGGMLWLATAELAAAVSNAGGLGIISSHAGMEKHGDPVENLRLQIAKIRNLTRKPFGINILLDLRESGTLIDLILQEKAGIVITAAGNPHLFTEVLCDEGIKVFHVVSSVKQAHSAESSGVHAVIAEGMEAGAHLGFDEIPLFSLIPQVADTVSIPVIAAGGIVDARGLVAAFALGAEGVQMGTRFVAVEESVAHPRYQGAILNAKDADTVITSRRLLPTRSIKTEFSRRLLELEASGASAEDLRSFLGYGRARAGQLEGDLENGEAYCGASAGLIKEIIPAAKVIQRLVEGYNQTTKKIT
jgi:enoyl-[acyl-carrier protein] reductase II